METTANVPKGYLGWFKTQQETNFIREGGKEFPGVIRPTHGMEHTPGSVEVAGTPFWGRE